MFAKGEAGDRECFLFVSFCFDRSIYIFGGSRWFIMLPVAHRSNKTIVNIATALKHKILKKINPLILSFCSSHCEILL